MRDRGFSDLPSGIPADESGLRVGYCIEDLIHVLHTAIKC